MNISRLGYKSRGLAWPISTLSIVEPIYACGVIDKRNTMYFGKFQKIPCNKIFFTYEFVNKTTFKLLAKQLNIFIYMYVLCVTGIFEKIFNWD